jgi:hypothetical protein
LISFRATLAGLDRVAGLLLDLEAPFPVSRLRLHQQLVYRHLRAGALFGSLLGVHLDPLI